ncbi:hypothetical protein WJX81_001993 [Elliptochloris bilobata]|uniref:Uncharacterized protein n=1 Tax=Elliptochloris bilobata TaxID=381761 RepID=A0AAW1QL92_9CHLO
MKQPASKDRPAIIRPGKACMAYIVRKSVVLFLARCLAYPGLHRHLELLKADALDADSFASAPAGGIIFALFYAQGDRGTEGFDSHQLARPDFNFVPALRRSNPGCSIAVLTDQAT